ncbi:MAG: DNA-binding protein [Spirochaetae bacterium HGW-Spirochaetae-1]|jgi:hypothetical protein|nr:MAG: DNA-binding protein [Spirochaetae bacterium HGW-Spirochaetae-1]
MKDNERTALEQGFDGIEPMVYESKISVPYSWWAGETATHFLKSLRDDKKILALKCSKCGKTFVPPRKVCPTCFVKNTEWVELSGKGTLQSFTVARRQLAAIQKKVPVIYGLIKLDGADTAMLHYLEGIAPEKVKIGMRVEAQFASDRNGTIQDIEFFRPV